MARQLNVNLVFNANTQQARQQMASLQNSVTQLQTSMASNISMSSFTNELNKAQSVVASLKTNLNSAFDVNTGKLDLTKFNQNLQRSNMTLKDYRISLQQLGPEGQRAFNQLTQSIIQGQMPIQKTKNLLTSMMDTFGSSIKWSIAYGAINRISQGFQEAFQYAQDLNESLVNIRVVTGLSADEMVRFAETANKAAKALATTTTDYTKAALIYYQQGLEGKAVEERAETTLKLANVTGQTAEIVSDQMTAVWNNFYDGSKSLEYYADVLTALGAATASSTDEISQGLEKFAAVAETVGLSYEYATTALATVTAQTRQSADVVGTAFKTLFARIQDLELGKTLDDGTTLGAYSEALSKVDINIKDASGGLKDMDDILNEMGAKWRQIDKDQQVALAKSVAGIRQYTQLIALMDNWETFEMNLTVAETAEGTLQEQQDIWAESWEAAQKRVKASVEDLYNTLIDDKFFIDLNNMFADLLSGLDEFLEAMGGLKTLIPLVGGLLLKAFGPMALSAIQGFSNNLMGPKAAAMNQAAGLRTTALKENIAMSGELGTQSATTQAELQQGELQIVEQVEGLTRNISKLEAEQIQYLIQENQEYAKMLQMVTEIIDKRDQASNKINNQRADQELDLEASKQMLQGKSKAGSLDDKFTQIESIFAQATKGQIAFDTFSEADTTSSSGRFSRSKANTNIKNLKESAGYANLDENTKGMIDNFKGGQKDYEAIKKAVSGTDLIAKASSSTFTELNNSVENGAEDAKKYVATQKQMAEGQRTVAANSRANARSQKAVNEGLETYKNKVNQATSAIQKMNKAPLGETLVSAAGAIGSAAAGLSMLVSGVENLTQMFTTGEHSLSGWLGVLTSIGFAVPMLSGGLKSLAGTLGFLNSYTAVTNALGVVTEKQLKSKKALTAEQIALQRGEAVAKALNLNVDQLVNAELTKENILTNLGNMSKGKAIALSIAMKAASILEAVGLGALIPAKYADAAASAAAGAGTMAMLWPIGLLVLAIAGLVAVIAGLIAIFKALQNAYNADAIAAEKASKKARELTEDLGKTKEAYDALKKSIEDYDKAQNAIDSLTKGTKEWRDAINEANQQVIEMLDKYPELSQYVQDIDGRLTISAEGLLAFQEQEAKRLAIQQNMVNQANLDAKQAQLKADKTEALRGKLDTHKVDGWDSLAGIAASGLLALIPVIGPVLATASAGVTAAAAIATNEIEYDKAEALLESLGQVYEEKGEVIFADFDKTLTDLGVTTGKLKDTFTEEIDTVQELVRQQKLYMEQQELLRKKEVYDLLSAEEGFNAQRYSDGVAERVGELYDQEIAKNSVEIEKLHRRDGWSYLWGGLSFGITSMAGWYNETSTELGKDYLDQYAKLMGYTDIKDVNWTKNGEVTFKSQSESGGEYSETRTLSYEDLVEAVAKANVDSVALVNKANELIDSYSSKIKNENVGAQILGTYLRDGSLKALDPELASKYFSGEISIDDIMGEMSQQDLELWGVKAAHQLEDALIDGLKNYDAEEAQYLILKRRWESYRQTITAGAQALEMEESILETYTAVLVSNSEALKENEDIAAELAVTHFTLAKGVKNLREVFQDNYDALKDTSNWLNYSEAIGNVKDALDKAFGTNASSNFIEDNLSTIEEMLNGSVEALEKIRKGLVIDLAKNLKFDSAELYNNFIKDIEKLIDEVNSKDYTVNAKIDFDNTSILDGLNEALKTGQLTVDQIKSMFSNANLQWDPDLLTYYEMPTESRSISTSIGYNGTEVISNSTTETYTQTMTQMPWLGKEALKPKYVKAKARDTSSNEIITKYVEVSEIDTSLEGNEQYIDTKAKYIADRENNNEFSAKYIGGVNNLKDILTYGINDKDIKSRLSELEDELDRYHEINKIINDIQRSIDKLGKAKDRAYGNSKLALIDKEIAKQKELIKNNEELLRQAQANLTIDKNNLIANTSSNLSLNFDSNGNISNYEKLQQSYIDRLAAAATNETLYDEINKEYEKFKNAAQQYEDTVQQIEDAQDAIEDAQDALYDANLEKIEYTVQIKVDIADDDKAYIDFLMQKIEDDAFAAADAIGLLGREAETALDKIQANQEGITAIEAAVANGEITTAQAVEKLREYRDELIDLNADLLEIRQTVQDKLTEAFEAWNEKIEKGISKLEFYGSVLEGYQNIIDIVGKDMLGVSDETMANLNKAMVSNANDIIRSTKAQLDANEATLTSMREAREAAAARGDEESVKEWDEQIKLAEEKSQELSTTLQDALTTGLEAAVAEFENTINQIADSFGKAVSGIYGSIEEMREGWDRQQEIAERYLDTYKQTYELNKLNRQIQKSIDSTDNVSSQKQLRALQQEMLEMSKDGQQLSKYDLEYLQKKYDLMVAEQAFRDAQNAKSVVRLTRDSEGNFGYVYTADQGAVDNAQQNYEDKLYAYQEFSVNMEKELVEFTISANEKMEEAIRQAAEMYGEGTEEYLKAVEIIKQQYAEDMKYVETQYGGLIQRNEQMNAQFNTNLANNYHDTFISKIYPDYNKFSEFYNGTTGAMEDACDQLGIAIEKLEATFKTQFDLAGKDFENFANTANRELEEIQTDSSDTADAIEQMATDMDTALNGENGAIKAVEAFQTQFSSQMGTIRTETQNTINKTQKLIDKYREAAAAAGVELPPFEAGSTNGGKETDDKDKDNDIIKPPATPPSSTTKIISANVIKSAYGQTRTLSNGSTYFQADDGKWYDVTGLTATKGSTGLISYEVNKNLQGIDEQYLPRDISIDFYPDSKYKRGQKISSWAEGSGTSMEAALDKDGEARTDIYKEGRVPVEAVKGTGNDMINIGSPILDVYYSEKRKQYRYKFKTVNGTEVWIPGAVLNTQAQLFDTGGYTGAWGPEGRLAMLHQKEIVLNAHDTENFLAAIGIVRDISDQIEKNAVVMQYQNQLANYRASVGNNHDTLQQEVHITAEFPNATNHTEIEEAFKNLTNLASQYANRK